MSPLVGFPKNPLSANWLSQTKLPKVAANSRPSVSKAGELLFAGLVHGDRVGDMLRICEGGKLPQLRIANSIRVMAERPEAVRGRPERPETLLTGFVDTVLTIAKLVHTWYLYPEW